MSDIPDYITLNQACRLVGGEEKPISVATYYRGVKAGRLPAPEHPTPGISRIRCGELVAKLNRMDPPPDIKERPANLLAEGGRPIKASAGNQSNLLDSEPAAACEAPLNGRG